MSVRFQETARLGVSGPLEMGPRPRARRVPDSPSLPTRDLLGPRSREAVAQRL